MSRLSECPHCRHAKRWGCVLLRNGGYRCREPYMYGALRDALRDEPQSTAQICGSERFRRTMRHAARALRQLVRDGQAVNAGRGMWRRCEVGQ